MMAQFIGVIAVLIFTLLLSFLIAVFVKRLIGIRVSDDDIEAGLYISSHGQSGYKL